MCGNAKTINNSNILNNFDQNSHEINEDTIEIEDDHGSQDDIEIKAEIENAKSSNKIDPEFRWKVIKVLTAFN